MALETSIPTTTEIFSFIAFLRYPTLQQYGLLTPKQLFGLIERRTWRLLLGGGIRVPRTQRSTTSITNNEITKIHKKERYKDAKHLCRYITRPALANKRLKRSSAGDVVLQLKSPYHDGTTHIVMSPLEFMQRLAALVPRPRLHLFASTACSHLTEAPSRDHPDRAGQRQ